jgi:HD-GYP domain-containing protein (c-di-GMP phosphodiesterase class II)
MQQLSAPVLSHEARTSSGTPNAEIAGLRTELSTWLGAEFAIWKRDPWEPLPFDDRPAWANSLLGQLIPRRALDTVAPQILTEHDFFSLLTVPYTDSERQHYVAAAPVVTRHPSYADDVSEDAAWLGWDESITRHWLLGHAVIPRDVLPRLTAAVWGRMNAERQSQRLEREVVTLSHNLSSTYEEISLLYGLTHNLRISNSDEEFAETALSWLTECVSAESLSLYLAPVAKAEEVTYRARTESVVMSRGRQVLDAAQMQKLADTLELGPTSKPLVANRNVTSSRDWPFPAIRELIVTPLAEGDHLFGWLAAFNHREGKEFGTIEASLLSSVSAILGIHGGNRELYRQQNELLASVVRALTSAIDAKDPYTCGHSDRVARVAVRIAQELGCCTKTVQTIYMAGLVHDIGKIGISDAVLRKPGSLTPEEFEHIKLHPELGYKILCDIKQLSDVLPVVLHHHEQWNGRGYPHGLAGEAIPYLARICAVADAYDAMSSDRPYRKGMPEARVVQIFQEGAGVQWDRNVVAAFIAALDDIRRIGQHERAGLSLDVQRWAEAQASHA